MYGNPSVTPAVGGSGGAGGRNTLLEPGGGAGGGAIVIASSGKILLHGGISALGGSGTGSTSDGAPGAGGGIRLIANEISGTGFVRANGGTGGSASPGGDGRIRLEANLNSLDLSNNVSPVASESGPTCVFADPSQTPSLRVTTVNNQSVPVDPSATILTNDVTIATTDPVELLIEARNVPADTQTIFVTVRVVPQFGVPTEVQSATPLVGTFSLSTTSVTIAFPDTRSEVVLRIDTP